jgi:RNA recognition motif-containing protein
MQPIIGVGIGGLKYNPGTPSKTIMLRHLPFQMDESELRAELENQNINIKCVRLVRNRDTGQSRGFGFVEFYSIEEAQSWLESTQVLY